jgi:hypothetical protein
MKRAALGSRSRDDLNGLDAAKALYGLSAACRQNSSNGEKPSAQLNASHGLKAREPGNFFDSVNRLDGMNSLGEENGSNGVDGLFNGPFCFVFL